MFGPSPLRDIFLVAGFELREMLRSRRALLFSALYFLVAGLGSYIFVQFLTRVEPVNDFQAPRRDRGPFFQNAPATPTVPPMRRQTRPSPRKAGCFSAGRPFADF